LTYNELRDRYLHCFKEEQTIAQNLEHSVPASRLPRRPVPHPSVAELVKKYQEFLPAQGVHDLSRTALAPVTVISESEPEASPLPSQSRTRNRHSHQDPVKKSSVSDFEQGYAANVAPKHLASRRRGDSRIGAPLPLDSAQDNLRRTSLGPRPISADIGAKAGRTSPTNKLNMPSGGRIRSRIHSRPGIKDKSAAQRSPNIPTKSTFRRAPTAGSKVSNMAKHFERINRESERTTRRYAVIRGRRPRPVASARAKVEILDSVKDAVRDESESSDSSSEADDEGDSDDENPEATSKVSDSFGSLPGVTSETSPVLTTESPVEIAATSEETKELSEVDESLETQVSRPLLPVNECNEQITSVSPFPVMSTTPLNQPRPFSPILLDAEVGGNERSSILKALTGLWPQPAPSRFRQDPDVEDLITDPEHIFRDSSMVVRTDEPTSIIALALK
jgi:1-phosphatidylinositol-3-phosphate 5-kinase